MTAGFRAFAACLCVLLVAGCTQLPPRPTAATAAWSVPAWPDWEMRGRIAVRAGEEGWHASLAWRQTGEAFDLNLSGPLGQGALRLHGDAAGVTLERADGLRDRAADADSLLLRHTGWSLPVSGLRYWVQGLAAPGRPAEWERGADGRPLRLRQDGWDIRYVEYQQTPDRSPRPRRIELARDGLSARLLIDSWTPIVPG
ncbi:MAG: lipoprotein insertase outer membrane protein LolB [Gammaproteobacteria bacterium]